MRFIFRLFGRESCQICLWNAGELCSVGAQTLTFSLNRTKQNQRPKETSRRDAAVQKDETRSRPTDLTSSHTKSPKRFFCLRFTPWRGNKGKKRRENEKDVTTKQRPEETPRRDAAIWKDKTGSQPRFTKRFFYLRFTPLRKNKSKKGGKIKRTLRRIVSKQHWTNKTRLQPYLDLRKVLLTSGHSSCIPRVWD